MAHRPTNLLSDEETRFHVEELQGGKMDTVIELDAAPIAATPLLSANEWGSFGGKLYHRISGEIFEFTPSAVTVIT